MLDPKITNGNPELVTIELKTNNQKRLLRIKSKDKGGEVRYHLEYQPAPANLWKTIILSTIQPKPKPLKEKSSLKKSNQAPNIINFVKNFDEKFPTDKSVEAEKTLDIPLPTAIDQLSNTLKPEIKIEPSNIATATLNNDGTVTLSGANVGTAKITLTYTSQEGTKGNEKLQGTKVTKTFELKVTLKQGTNTINFAKDFPTSQQTLEFGQSQSITYPTDKLGNTLKPEIKIEPSNIATATLNNDGTVTLGGAKVGTATITLTYTSQEGTKGNEKLQGTEVTKTFELKVTPKQGINTIDFAKDFPTSQQTLEFGQSQSITYPTDKLGNTLKPEIKIEPSNIATATLNNDGTVTLSGANVGTATITLTYTSQDGTKGNQQLQGTEVTKTFELKVTPKQGTNEITFNGESPTNQSINIEEDITLPLLPTVIDKLGNTLKPEIKIESSNIATATLNNDGAVTLSGTKVGTATITLTYTSQEGTKGNEQLQGTKVTKTFTLEVRDVPINEVKFKSEFSQWFPHVTGGVKINPNEKDRITSEVIDAAGNSLKPEVTLVNPDDEKYKDLFKITTPSYNEVKDSTTKDHKIAYFTCIKENMPEPEPGDATQNEIRIPMTITWKSEAKIIDGKQTRAGKLVRNFVLIINKIASQDVESKNSLREFQTAKYAEGNVFTHEGSVGDSSRPVRSIGVLRDIQTRSELIPKITLVNGDPDAFYLSYSRASNLPIIVTPKKGGKTSRYKLEYTLPYYRERKDNNGDGVIDNIHHREKTITIFLDVSS